MTSDIHKINLKNVENTFINSQCITEPHPEESDHPKNGLWLYEAVDYVRHNWHWYNMQQETNFSVGTKTMNTCCNSYCIFVKLNSFVAFVFNITFKCMEMEHIVHRWDKCLSFVSASARICNILHSYFSDCYYMPGRSYSFCN